MLEYSARRPRSVRRSCSRDQGIGAIVERGGMGPGEVRHVEKAFDPTAAPRCEDERRRLLSPMTFHFWCRRYGRHGLADRLYWR
jgi:hypothetical protein